MCQNNNNKLPREIFENHFLKKKKKKIKYVNFLKQFYKKKKKKMYNGVNDKLMPNDTKR